jgi:hypothetical protein
MHFRWVCILVGYRLECAPWYSLLSAQTAINLVKAELILRGKITKDKLAETRVAHTPSRSSEPSSNSNDTIK